MTRIYLWRKEYVKEKEGKEILRQQPFQGLESKHKRIHKKKEQRKTKIEPSAGNIEGVCGKKEKGGLQDKR